MKTVTGRVSSSTKKPRASLVSHPSWPKASADPPASAEVPLDLGLKLQHQLHEMVLSHS